MILIHLFPFYFGAASWPDLPDSVRNDRSLQAVTPETDMMMMVEVFNVADLECAW